MVGTGNVPGFCRTLELGIVYIRSWLGRRPLLLGMEWECYYSIGNIVYQALAGRVLMHRVKFSLTSLVLQSSKLS